MTTYTTDDLTCIRCCLMHSAFVAIYLKVIGHPVVSSVGNTSSTSWSVFMSYVTLDLITVASSDSHTLLEQFIFVRYSANSFARIWPSGIRGLCSATVRTVYLKNKSVLNYINGRSDNCTITSGHCTKYYLQIVGIDGIGKFAWSIL